MQGPRDPAYSCTQKQFFTSVLPRGEFLGLGLNHMNLKAIQSDEHEWIQRGGVVVTNFKNHDMIVFPVTPLEDFRADLANLWEYEMHV